MKSIVVLLCVFVIPLSASADDRSTLPYYTDFVDKGEKSEYHKVRIQLRSEMGKQAELFAKMQRIEGLLRAQFQKNQWKSAHERVDSMLAFKMGMCVGLIEYNKFGVTQSQLFSTAEFFMKHAINPKDLEFSRILYIIQGWRSAYSDLIPVHKKLSKARPDDDAIKQSSIEVYAFSKKSEERSCALKLAEEQINKYPKSGALFWRYASVYEIEAYKTKNKNAAKKAITLYDEFMKKFGTSEDLKMVTIIKKYLNKVIDGTYKMTGG